jgi:hypothetical protein
LFVLTLLLFVAVIPLQSGLPQVKKFWEVARNSEERKQDKRLLFIPGEAFLDGASSIKKSNCKHYVTLRHGCVLLPQCLLINRSSSALSTLMSQVLTPRMHIYAVKTRSVELYLRNRHLEMETKLRKEREKSFISNWTFCFLLRK